MSVRGHCSRRAALLASILFIGLLLLCLIYLGSHLGGDLQQFINNRNITSEIQIHLIPQKLQNNNSDPFNHRVAMHAVPYKFLFADNSTKIDFMHIPKTGGISMIDDMKLLGIQCRRNDESSFLDNRIRNSHYLFTTFREPTSHLVSMWKYCRSKSSWRGTTEHADKMRKVPFDSWVHYWSYFADHFAERFGFNGTFEEFNHKHYSIDATTSRSRQLHEPFGCFYIPDNLQSTRLGVFDPETLRNTVRDIFHVGVQDMYRETLCVLAFKIHHRTLMQCSCGTTSEVFNHSNATPMKAAGQEVADMTTSNLLETAEPEDMERLTYIDRVVYEEARRRLEWEVQHIRKEYDADFLCQIVVR